MNYAVLIMDNRRSDDTSWKCSFARHECTYGE